MNALIIAPQWIGDAVMSEPLVSALAARGVRVSVAALPWVAPVCRAMPGVHEVLEVQFAHGRLDWLARYRVAQQWRGRFESAYILPNSLKAALVPFLARIPSRIGYLGENRYGLINRRVPRAPNAAAMVQFYYALSGEIGPAPVPRLRLASATLQAVLARYELVAQGYWVLAPGAEYGPAKCWPPAHYASLAQTLREQAGRPVVLLGSAKEKPLCESIASAVPGGCRVLAGQTSLEEALALIATARGMVSNDSGLMHVAAAFRVPQVAVFGSTSPERTPPLSEVAQVVWLKGELQLECQPCFERTCRYGHTRCLTEITPDRVLGSLKRAVSL